jgi:hypothetical protein
MTNEGHNAIAFTGTQIGMTPRQFARVGLILRSYMPKRFHSGDCIGADAQAFEIAANIGLYQVLHPPLNRSKAAGNGPRANENRQPLDYLDRNHAMVDECDFLIACPKGPEELRSGTWATVRYAIKKNKKVRIVMPDGA